jgi:hypothetical protein
MPGRAVRRPHTLTVDGERVTGSRYEEDEGPVRYRAQHYDLPETLALTAEEFARKAQAGTPEVAGGLRPVLLSGRPGVELVFKGSGNERETVRATKVGSRVFLFSVSHDPDRVKEYPGLDAEAKAREFFDSVAITFSPTSPGVTRPKPPRPEVPTLPGGFKVVGQVEPFLAAVALPEAGEVLAFAVRGPGAKPAGVVRRYSSSTWKQLGEAHLPAPVVYAAADEKAGRLYVGTATRDVTGRDVPDRLTAVGEVQAFDLKAVRADAPPKGELKPVATARLPVGSGAKIAGLELDPKGKAVYTATVVMQSGGKAHRSRVWRLSPSDLSPAGPDIELSQPVGHLRLSPDGKHLLAAEMMYNSFGHPQATAAVTHAHLIDAANWKKERAIQLPGTVAALAFVETGKAVAVLAPGGRQRLYALDVRGEPADVTPSPALRVAGAGFLAVAGDKVVVSARHASGTEVLSLAGTGPAKSVGHTIAAGGLISGPVVAAPDGKSAAYGSGVVLDLSAAGK